MAKDTEALVTAFLDHLAMEEVRVYLERGRRFSAVPDEDLNKAWVVVFELCANGDQSNAAELDDLGAELELRGLSKPDHLVSRQAMDAVQRRLRELPRELRQAAMSKISQFLEDIDKPKN